MSRFSQRGGFDCGHITQYKCVGACPRDGHMSALEHDRYIDADNNVGRYHHQHCK